MSNVEEQIRRAIEEGRFDDLPGKGKPLQLDQDPHEDPDWRLAYHMLRSSGYSLPWIEKRREIEADLEDARQGLQRSWTWRMRASGESQVQPFVEVEWEAAVEKFRQQVALINKRIISYNLEVPSERFQLRPLNFERELGLILQAGR